MKNNYCTFYIIRHGQTNWNVKKLIQGHVDIPLNKTGEKQAEEAKKLLSGIYFDAVFSSDLLRAKRTAELIAMEQKIVVQETKLLREQYYGSFQGKQVKEYLDTFRKYIRNMKKITHTQRKTLKVGDRETDEKLIQRVILFLREAAVAYKGKTVLVVTHGGVMRTLLVHLGFATYEDLHEGLIKNIAYIKLASDGVDFFVKETSGIEKKSDIILSYK